MEFELYATASGKEPVADFLDKLSPQQLQKVDDVFRVIEETEGLVPANLFRKLKGTQDIWEIRVSAWGSAIPVVFS